MTYLAVPIKVSDLEQALGDIARAAAAGAELLELRLDYLGVDNAEVVRQVVAAAKDTNLPVIATCRAKWEGGQFEQGEKSRLKVFKQAVRAGADYVDIESACRELGEIDPKMLEAKRLSFKVIRSSHDFEKRPDDLEQRVKQMEAQQADVGKVAYMAERISDCFGALDLMHAHHVAGKEFIAMAMGEAGVMTRLLAKKLGAMLTFASLEDGAESAPGQVSLAAMRGMYRWAQVTDNTMVYGVVACPVGHSMSPAIHNAGFDEVGFDGLYLPLLVDGSWEEFKAFMDGVIERKWLDFKGLSVTIPHKDNALRYVKETGGELEDLACKIGAVNTLVIDEAGKVSGYNTDYAGALDALTGGMGIERAELRRLPAAVVGAGGVGRAVVAGLTDVGAEVTIYNRTVSKAKGLAEEFGCGYAGLEGLEALEAKVVINCSSVGMRPGVDASPLPEGVIGGDMVVFDTVYNPMETKLLRQAKAAGAVTVDGVSMFVNQAAAQFGLFTGLEGPRAVMRAVVEKALG